MYILFYLCWFCYDLTLNACFSIVCKVLVTELYAGFWDVLKLGGVPIGFEKLLGLGFWFCYRFSWRSLS